MPHDSKLADKILNDQAPGAAVTRNGEATRTEPKVDLRKPVSTSK